MTTPQPYQTGGLSPTSQERNWAMAAHLGCFLAAYVALGLLAPLAVLLVKGGESPFVRRHAVESLNFQITTLLWVVLAVALGVVTLGPELIVVLPLAMAYAIFYLVVLIVAGVRAAGGRDYRYPLTWRLVH
jgi:uncharacterized Tic20 family protein